MFSASELRTVVNGSNGSISGILNESPTLSDNDARGKIAKSIIQNLNAIRGAAITCGILAAACVLIVIAVKYSVTANPINRNEVKKWTVALIIGTVALGAVSALCAFLYSFGANL